MSHNCTHLTFNITLTSVEKNSRRCDVKIRSKSEADELEWYPWLRITESMTGLVGSGLGIYPGRIRSSGSKVLIKFRLRRESIWKKDARRVRVDDVIATQRL